MGLLDGRERDGDVREQFGIDPADADEGDRAEAHVTADADDELDSPLEGRRLLDRAVGWAERGHAREDALELTLPCDADCNATLVGLGREADGLEHYRVAGLGGRG